MIRGVVYVLASSLLFALSTVFAKEVHKLSDIPAVEVTFFRFLTGFIVALFYVLHTKKTLKPEKLRFIIYRSIFNTAAVILFFAGVQHTTVSKANLLNLTSPIFIFALAPFLNGEHITPRYYLYLLLSMTGIYMVLIPGGGGKALTLSTIDIGDILSLASGLAAAFALIYLREARKYDRTYIILFYLMLIGTVINLIAVIPIWTTPHGMVTVHLALSATCAVAGQYAVTEGYRFITSTTGSIVSSSRLLFAAFLGIIFFEDPMTTRIILGGILIALSLAGVSGAGRWFRVNHPKKQTHRVFSKHR